MTTALVTGAPYMTGDPVMVEYAGDWHEATILAVDALPTARFGLRWVLTVVAPTAATRVPNDPQVYSCDDNGRNHTYRQQVCPAPPTDA